MRSTRRGRARARAAAGEAPRLLRAVAEGCRATARPSARCFSRATFRPRSCSTWHAAYAARMVATASRPSPRSISPTSVTPSAGCAACGGRTTTCTARPPTSRRSKPSSTSCTSADCAASPSSPASTVAGHGWLRDRPRGRRPARRAGTGVPARADQHRGALRPTSIRCSWRGCRART